MSAQMWTVHSQNGNETSRSEASGGDDLGVKRLWCYFI